MALSNRSPDPVDLYRRLHAGARRLVGLAPADEEANADERDGADVEGGADEGVRGRSTAESVLTTEQRIESLLRRGGGRVWQSDLVETLDVSAASVSRRLSEMEAAGEVVRRKVGRRNIVMLPDAFEASEAWDDYPPPE